MIEVKRKKRGFGVVAGFVFIGSLSAAPSGSAPADAQPAVVQTAGGFSGYSGYTETAFGTDEILFRSRVSVADTVWFTRMRWSAFRTELAGASADGEPYRIEFGPLRRPDSGGIAFHSSYFSFGTLSVAGAFSRMVHPLNLRAGSTALRDTDRFSVDSGRYRAPLTGAVFHPGPHALWYLEHALWRSAGASVARNMGNTGIRLVVATETLLPQPRDYQDDPWFRELPPVTGVSRERIGLSVSRKSNSSPVSLAAELWRVAPAVTPSGSYAMGTAQYRRRGSSFSLFVSGSTPAFTDMSGTSRAEYATLSASGNVRISLFRGERLGVAALMRGNAYRGWGNGTVGNPAETPVESTADAAVELPFTVVRGVTASPGGAVSWTETGSSAKMHVTIHPYRTWFRFRADARLREGVWENRAVELTLATTGTRSLSARVGASVDWDRSGNLSDAGASAELGFGSNHLITVQWRASTPNAALGSPVSAAFDPLPYAQTDNAYLRIRYRREFSTP